jgi:hypothetical protein
MEISVGIFTISFDGIATSTALYRSYPADAFVALVGIVAFSVSLHTRR